MSFWIRHAFILAFSVLVPFCAALYTDTTTTAEEAHKRSRHYVQQAVPRLLRMVERDSYDALTRAMALAQQAVLDDRVNDLGRSGSRGAKALQGILQLLEEAKPKRGFAWLVDAQGRVLLAAGESEIDENPRSVRGHPVFIETQRGYALDGLWRTEPNFMFAVGAPLVDGDEIRGAILLGRPIDSEAVAIWAGKVGGHVTLALNKTVLVSTASDELAKTVVDAAEKEVISFGGQSEVPLTDGTLPFLPLFVDHRADGNAYVSYSTPVEGVPPQFTWVVSVDATSGLTEIARRQSAILGAMVASFLVALLIGILNYRSYVVPINTVAHHLSELNMGRGDLELPENRVSVPFRRIVKLINMTVQKLPSRSLIQPSSTDMLSMTRPPGAVGPEEDLSLGEWASGVGGVGSTPLSIPPKPLAAPPGPSPSVPDLVMGADGLDGLSFDSLPPSPVPPSVPMPVAHDFGRGYEVSEETEAAMPPGAQTPAGGADLSALGIPSTPGAEEAIADAIAQLEGAQPVDNDQMISLGGSRRSAADIRGRPMGGEGMARETTPYEEVSVPPSGPVPPRPGVRGGGSLELGQSAALPYVPEEERAAFGPEETVVAPVASELLAQSAREDLTGRHTFSPDEKPDATVVATVPADLLAQSAARDGASRGAGNAGGAAQNLDPEDRAHFKEVYDRFIELRRKCGEPTNDLAFERFLSKLTRNRDTLVKKYNCRTVRFQVYKKDGKAALKATPVGAR